MPTLAASVGEKKPHMMPPTTRRKMTSTHMVSGTEAARSFQVKRGPLGAISGLILDHPYMIRTKRTAVRRPGTMPARNSYPIDCSVRMPSMMRKTLGGIRHPSVPTDATIPVESLRSYL